MYILTILHIVYISTCTNYTTQTIAEIYTKFLDVHTNGLFTLPDSDSDPDSDSKPDGYIVLCRNIPIGSDPDPDPCTESFPNHYCTHFRDRSLSLFYTFQSENQSGSEPM